VRLKESSAFEYNETVEAGLTTAESA